MAIIFGTRPEAIKLAPLIKFFQQYPEIVKVRVIVTGQHREMLDQVLELFQIKPDWDMNVMKHDQTLSEVVAISLTKLEAIFADDRPDMVVVQGDTSTAFVGALAAFYQQIPIAHIEAGLRTGDRFHPYPEEVNRRIISVLSNLHFVATKGAGNNLRKEGVPEKFITMTGNTVIDALGLVLGQPRNLPSSLASILEKDDTRRILVTVHRRENHGKPLQEICSAINKLLQITTNLEVIFLVHPNPQVQSIVRRRLKSQPRVHLYPPLNYWSFIQTMTRVDLVLTDSGGIQEEAPSLGVPVLVLREKTERPEAVEVGAVKVIGTKTEDIVSEVSQLLVKRQGLAAIRYQGNPFGDGRACQRIFWVIARYLGVKKQNYLEKEIVTPR